MARPPAMTSRVMAGASSVQMSRTACVRVWEVFCGCPCTQSCVFNEETRYCFSGHCRALPLTARLQTC